MAKSFQVDTGGTLTTNLVSYYKMEGDSTDFYGTENGMDTNMTYGLSYGKIDQGANFSGSGQIAVGTPAVGTSNQFSYSFWIKGFNANCQPMGHRTDAGLQWRMIYIASNGIVSLIMRNNNYVQTDSTSALDSNWHHIVATYDGTNQRIYFDGSKQGETANSSSPGALSVDIGDTAGSSSAKLIGNMDEVGIWSKALSQQEITDLYNSGSGNTMVSTGTANTNFFLLF